MTQVPGFLSWWGGGGALIPLGISFFSFNLVSYVIDVYQARIEPARSIIEFASYATFFPSISSGPLVRYGQFGPGHGEQGSPSWENTGWGLQRFAIGLAKKALVADQIAVFINPLLAQYQGLSPMDAWLVMLGFHFQIYYDFSGYSDMAIGVARLLGISLPENFDSPYVSSSISEFWRRWHMTLSFWFRDYLFMPLSRGLLRLWSGRFRQAARPLGLTVTMLLIGLWHGAAWTYALFGLYQGLLLAVEPQVGRLFRGKVPRLIARGGTTLLLMAGWVLFRSQSFEMATSLLQRMLGIKGGALPSMVLQSPQGFWFIFLLLALLVVTNLPVDDRVLLTRNTAWAALVMAILLLLGILSLDKPIPFLYYQF